MKKAFSICVLLSSSCAFSHPNPAGTGLSVLVGADINHNLSTNVVDFEHKNLHGSTLANPNAVHEIAKYKLKFTDKLGALPVSGVSYMHRISTGDAIGMSATIDLSRPERKSYIANQTFRPSPADNPATSYSMASILEQNQHWGIGINYAHPFSPTHAVYLKLSYHDMKADLFDKLSNIRSFTNPITSAPNVRQKLHFGGVGFSVGNRRYLNEHWFISDEFEYVQYAKKHAPGPYLIDTPAEITISQSHSLKPHFLSFKVNVGYEI